MFQSRKVRLKPDKAQAEFFRQNFGAARFVYNWGLEQLNKHREENKDKEKKDRAKRPSAFDLTNKLNHLKNTTEEYAWLKEVDSRILSFTFANLDNAFKRFSARQAKYPKFKSKRDSRQSYSTKTPSYPRLKDSNHILLPKIGSVKFYNRNYLPEMNTSPAPVSGASMDGHSPLLNSQTTKPNISFMNVLWINQEVTLPLTKSVIDKQVEAAEIMGRICYKSEPKGDPIAFLSRIINRGHESVIEHINIPAVLSTDRAVTHQLVRHRHAVFSQESQRFVNYSRKGIICFVRPQFFSDEKVDPKTIEEFKNTCQNLAEKYVELVQGGLPPEEARGLLPNCTATVIGVTANLREWRHIFRMRLDGAAQPQIRALLLALRQKMELKYDLAWAFKDIPVNANRLHSVPELWAK